MSAPVSNPVRIALRGTAAGAAGGVLLAAVLLGAGLRGAGHISAIELAVLYAAACIAWGTGYAYLAATQPQINRFPVLSGLSFGIVVYVVTQLVLYGIAAEQIHTAQQVAFGMSATCLFFGLPVALISRLLERTR